jgi:hypothetical protein
MDTGDDEMLHVIKESFQLLFTKKTFEPLFAEPYHLHFDEVEITRRS